MNLARMDDIVGCRLIFDDIADLHEFRESMHKSKFKHSRRNDTDKYDYIKTPKDTGYRGIHDVYSYDVNSQQGKVLKGLSIEIQYRTRIQHAWATSVEVINHITQGKSQPKFEQGDEKYIYAMKIASEILDRVYENKNSCFSGKTDSEIVEMFKKIDNEISLLKQFRRINKINSSDGIDYKSRDIILIIDNQSKLEIKKYKSGTAALKGLFELEKEILSKEKDLVFVRGDLPDVRDAFRNYFSDTSDFVKLIEEGCRKLQKSSK